jgi:hypothetical protein
MIKVIAVKANDDYTLDLTFNDGSVKRFDVKPYLKYEVFKELQDLRYFKRVKLAFGSVQWPNEQDIAPETLFLDGDASLDSHNAKGR